MAKAAKKTTKKTTKVAKTAKAPAASTRTAKTAKTAKTVKKTAKKAPSANKPLTKSEIYNYMADKVGITRQQAKMFFDEQAELAYVQVKKNPKGFTVPGIGKMVIRDRKARMGRNPRTGEPIKIKAKKTLKFSIAKPAKDALDPAKK
jgi:DNA-binding protein HU-beta